MRRERQGCIWVRNIQLDNKRISLDKIVKVSVVTNVKIQDEFFSHRFFYFVDQ